MLLALRSGLLILGREPPPWSPQIQSKQGGSTRGAEVGYLRDGAITHTDSRGVRLTAHMLLLKHGVVGEGGLSNHTQWE